MNVKVVSITILISLGLKVMAQDDTEINSQKVFFDRLANGVWCTENKKNDGQNDFSHFLMTFKLSEFGGLEGTISGVSARNDTIVFWKILEFPDVILNKTKFIQRGNSGYAIGNSVYESANIRRSEFNLVYANGEKELHKDSHTFMEDGTIVTKSEVFEIESNQWKIKSELIWKQLQ